MDSKLKKEQKGEDVTSNTGDFDTCLISSASFHTDSFHLLGSSYFNITRLDEMV